MNASRLAPAIATAVGALLLAAAPAAARTQQAPQIPDSVRQMLMELQQVRQELATIQEQTIEANAELRTEREAAQETVEAAMIEAHPGIEKTIGRLEALGDELQQARAQKDTARMREILLEGQRMQREIQSAQAEAMQRQDVARKIETYQDDLLEAMKAQDPRTDELLARMENLAERIQAAGTQ